MKKINFQWPLGFTAGATHAGFKKEAKLDLCWVVSDVPTAAAGVYTKNQAQAAPVQYTKQLISTQQTLQAIVINSGNANSFTGKTGLENAEKSGTLVAKKLGIPSDLVGVASTGIIGKQLDMQVFEKGVESLTSSNDLSATEAILTTDTTSKKICVQVEIDQQPVTITGFAKGSGMIHPNMGTTLGFIMTDVAIDGVDLQQILKEGIVNSFNQITVDGCMSTNDMVLSLANGQAQNQKLTPHHAEFAKFKEAYLTVLHSLAKQVASDGEGANTLIEVEVQHAATHAEANLAAKAIVGSNLVKSMVFGSEGNWGRIVQALGQTDVKFDLQKLTIKFADLTVVQDSEGQSVDPAELKSYLDGDQIKVLVDLHVGNASGKAWGCDLTYKYVEINAAYEE
ncbi:bifunctional glutamate N-acetyltransferase/amino-acid acetyltransferase ArgJ [Fructilactobacillus frigidiflavus]|uniref:bifunctional glutamate N-acetyltransferase/amino-acid acetyltransferase ArgJ n=1 Tax=Fructilactobacillus frigidiflavus TaxID=3242688 RepID=UPI003757A09A